jgi:hypothetical protein
LRYITEHIEQLELKLLHTDFTVNSALIDDFLSVDFEEISENGQVNSRNSVIHWLLHKDNDVQWLLKDFRIKVLTEDLVLANYIAKKCNNRDSISKESTRTSLWRHQEGTWKMVFHQATKISAI